MAMPNSPAPNRIEIPQFPDGKRIAVTTSFDDGVVEDRKVIEAFNEWGLKGTFNLNSGKLGRSGELKPIQPNVGAYLDASEVESLYAGHEVAIHTVTHPWLDRLEPSQIATEVLDDRKALEDLVGYPVRGMAYPFAAFNDQVIQVLRALGIVYCRTVERSENCFPAKEPLVWATTGHQFHEAASPAKWDAFYGNPKSRGVFFVWGHSYEFNRPASISPGSTSPGNSSPAHDWSDLPRVFKPLAGKPDVWYCTNIQLFDYEAARRAMVISANRKSAFNPSGIPVMLDLDGKLLRVAPGQTLSL